MRWLNQQINQSIILKKEEANGCAWQLGYIYIVKSKIVLDILTTVLVVLSNKTIFHLKQDKSYPSIHFKEELTNHRLLIKGMLSKKRRMLLSRTLQNIPKDIINIYFLYSHSIKVQGITWFNVYFLEIPSVSFIQRQQQVYFETVCCFW